MRGTAVDTPSRHSPWRDMNPDEWDRASRAVDTPAPPEPLTAREEADLRRQLAAGTYWIGPVRVERLLATLDAARALATPDPSIPERPDPPTYRDERLRDWTAGYDAGLRTALGSIPERPAEPLPTCPIDGKPATMHACNLGHSWSAALQSTPESRHPDDGHRHSFGCRLCGVDQPPFYSPAFDEGDGSYKP